MKRFYRLLPILLVGLALGACKGGPMVKEDMAGNAAQGKETVVVPEDKAASEAVAVENLKSDSSRQGGVKYSALAPGDEITKSAEAEGKLLAVHFEFDNYAIRDSDKPLLENNAKWLKLNSGVKVQIEGHADERGENEYNLALGDKRAKSVEKYLETLGVKGGRLSTISYGEEKPADQGHSEDAWAANRRAEFKLLN